MADGTAIEWTDATWNPIIGCSVVSPGCTNCYAMRLAGTRLRNHPTRQGLTIETKAGPVWNGKVRLNEDELRAPLRWKRPRNIFVCAHADLFADQVSDRWIDKVFATMIDAPQHTYQVLTKRPARAKAYIEALPERRRAWDCHSALDNAAWPLPNLHLGVSVEDQARADERIPILLETPAAKRWISAEPLLGAIDLTAFEYGPPIGNAPTYADYLQGRLWMPEGSWSGRGYTANGRTYVDLTLRLDWVVVGGESGPGSRPMHPDWVRQIRDDCAAAGVPFLFKQWGNWMPVSQMPDGMSDDLYHPPPARDPEGIRRCKVANTVLNRDGHQPKWNDPTHYRHGEGSMLMFEVGKKAAGRLLDGVEHNGMPGERGQ
ncbi:phage Gp37/Gp68 family protein [Caulobacter sp. 3R27C2-B]|uniref:phage Gp37/Gp68 family protein n=1 Tax=Caulobacter sp. 3R27C2-B TaxID=2502219 RepID=UPI0010F663EF|nr:phage Gp37/Gp68 family protein [Caulobacter sp. 3R27C2-B]